VFLPLIGIVALVISLGYWVVTMVRRPKTIAYPSAAVVHRASRPDYSAEFGTPPPTPASAAAPSAWEDVVPKVPVVPLQPEAEPPPVEPEASPAHEWPELPAHEVEAQMREFLRPPDETLEPPKPGG
jgi:hypothetical protein